MPRQIGTRVSITDRIRVWNWKPVERGILRGRFYLSLAPGVTFDCGLYEVGGMLQVWLPDSPHRSLRPNMVSQPLLFASPAVRRRILNAVKRHLSRIGYDLARSRRDE